MWSCKTVFETHISTFFSFLVFFVHTPCQDKVAAIFYMFDTNDNIIKMTFLKKCYVWTYDNMILKILVNHANTDTTLEKNFFWWKVLCRSTQFTKSCTCVTESKLSGWKDKIFWFLFGYQLGSCWGIAVIYSLTLHMNNEHPLLVTLSLFEDRKHPEEVG